MSANQVSRTLIARELATRTPEFGPGESGQICGGCGADLSREDCDYEAHREADQETHYELMEER